MKHVAIIILLFVLGLIIAIGGSTTDHRDDHRATDTAPSNPTSSSTDRTATTGHGGASSQKAGRTVQVARIIDGDTIELASGETVRYIGIDTPETVHPTRAPECFGRKAREANRKLVSGKRVRIVRDVSDRDKYNRLLRYVYVPASSTGKNGTFVNQWLVRNGYAYASSYPPDVSRQEVLRSAQQKARNDERGLWRECETASEKPAPDMTEGRKKECAVKGNISYDDNEKIYHVPGCDYYEQTVIDEDDGEQWFCSEQEARAAGWRKAHNCP